MNIFMKRTLTKKLDYCEYQFKHKESKSKNEIIILNYCKHGNLETSSKVFLYLDKRNLCVKCAEEKSLLNTHIDFSDYPRVIDILKDPNKKISKQELFLWYPEIYGAINRMLGDYWQQKLYMFLNNISKNPTCSCGNPIFFNPKTGQFHNKCEHCTRKNAVKLSTTKRSIDMWTKIFKEEFKIDKPNFIVKDLYNIEITINNKIFLIKKSHIHQRQKWGILMYELIDETHFDKDYYLNEFKNNYDKYKMFSEKILKNYNPYIYKLLTNIIREYNITDFDELKYFVKNDFVRPKCTLCDNYAAFNHSETKYMINCEKHKYQVFSSTSENEIYEFIKQIYNGKILRTHRINSIGEIDIFIPDLNIGIEYNGLYWHSDKIKPKDYHYNKWKSCNEKEIKLITVWEDDWTFKQNIIKSIIKNQLGLNENKIYARNCQIKNINKKEGKLFLEQNHIQGDCVYSIGLGLYQKDELISVMTFGKRRMIMGSKSKNENEYELIRFCNKINISAIGGITKLFSYFIKNYNPSLIVSYANLDLFNGNSYEILGFKRTSDIKLNYWWAKDKRYHRSKFMKYKLIKEGADPNKTEDEIMRERCYNKVWGCGNIKWIYDSG